ncbi:hypothetical protein [Sphingomonas sp. GC_Shp_3]|uniref:hypothetical protein n=1 Tax=Sphingomonas sp. GC_Shp_3 TaxID=2937383 RepID=UPI00226ADB3F|nr:hypothetical protein [Sphingomonas sp. GC_Shp_3]
MADPVGALSDWIARNAPIMVGLGIGTAAKYGLTLSEGRKLNVRSLVADMLLLGMLGLLAVTIADWCNLTGNARVLVGALSAVSSDRLVRLARDRFMKKVESDLGATIKTAPSIAARVPAGIGEPDSVAIMPGAADSKTARTGAALREAYRTSISRRPPADQIDALRDLDDPDT